jgi:hypothetical protein
MNMPAAAGTGLLVLGMHRSGTSATAGALQRLGVRLGDRLVPAAADNPGGYFEHADAVAANEQLLDALDRSWDDVRALPAGWMKTVAAAEARERIRVDALAGLAGPGAWALKDPRLCRLLPLWRATLDAAGMRAACLLVLRHPDEVAASLRARDGLPDTIAHVLWLRYMLEAATASAGAPRVVLSYARLLEHPAAALREAVAQLGIELAPADDADLRAFVRPDARHHAAGEGELPLDAWHALALDAHAALAGHDPWAHVPDLVERFDALVDAHSDWIDLVGAASRGADVRRRAVLERGLATEHGLRASLADVTGLSLARLDALHDVQARLDATQAALASAEALCGERLEDVHRLDRQLAGTQAALARIEAQSVERLEDARRLDARLRDTQAALDRAEALSIERLEQVRRLDARLQETQAALDDAEGQARSHLSAAQALDAQLRDTQGAVLRLEALSFERLSEAQRLGDELGRTQQALAAVEALAVARMEDAQQLDQRLRDALAAHADTVAERDAERARAAEAEDQLARIRATWYWRVAARLHRLLRRPPPGSAA